MKFAAYKNNTFGEVKWGDRNRIKNKFRQKE